MRNDANKSKSKKWTIFFAVLSIFLLFSLIAALSAPKTQTIQQASQTTTAQTPQATTTQPTEPQATTYPTYTAPTTPAPTSNYVPTTTCNPDYTGGMNCTTDSASGLSTTHCSTNYTGGYICE